MKHDITLGPNANLNTETHKNSVRIKAPNSVNASKRKHKNQINHYNKQRGVLMVNSTSFEPILGIISGANKFSKIRNGI